MEVDLNHIREWVWKIGQDVEVALKNAKKTIVLQDADLAYATVLGDQPINRDSRECDRLCHTFIARYLPGAGILREMASTIRVNVALERVGDYAVTICREAMQLPDGLPDKFASKLDHLADRSIDILLQSRTAFRNGNAELAAALTKSAQQVQVAMDDIYEELFAEDANMDGRTMMAIFVIFNLLKRTADQAKNICDQTVYAVRGIAKMPKVYKILFLDQAGSGLAQLAVSIGRKNFPQTGYFACATPGGSEPLPAALRQFLVDTGLPDENLETEPMEAMEHDFADFTIIVGLNCKVTDYVPVIPFHTTPLNWEISTSADWPERYRRLRNEITDLVTLLAGDVTS
jgi:phosphate transport system protein